MVNLSRDETREAITAHFDLESFSLLLQVIRGGFGGHAFQMKSHVGTNPIEYTRRVEELSETPVDQPPIPTPVAPERTPRQTVPPAVLQRASKKHDTSERELFHTEDTWKHES
jgi:hypothetical protein